MAKKWRTVVTYHTLASDIVGLVVDDTAVRYRAARKE
jgi:hypothetical protein